MSFTQQRSAMSDHETDQGSKPDQDGEVIVEGSETSGTNEIDWDEEHDNLGSEWFNPDPGTHKVVFLDDGEIDTRTYEDDNGNKEEREVGIFTVDVDGETLKWSVTKGSTESSLWGQLVKYAKHHDGLAGEEITLIRNGEGSDTTYTVQEAAEL